MSGPPGSSFMGTLRRRLRSLRQPRHLSAPFLPRLRQEAHGLIWFASQLVRSPREVGAICPSGQSLARGMAALIPETPGLVVEFGAGTGVVTQAILDRGVARDRLLVIEYSPRFCAILRRKFPDLTIIQGDAAKLSSYLPPDARIAAIVSSLPLMSLPKQTRASIIAQVRSVMRQEGCIIQFTYALWAASPFRRAGYQPDSRKIILLNLPPARLERFRIAGQNPAASTLRDCAIR